MQNCIDFIPYTTAQQITILKSCKCATELLETKELLESLQALHCYVYDYFDLKMLVFLHSNKIA